jgi:hypothetical protein
VGLHPRKPAGLSRENHIARLSLKPLTGVAVHFSPMSQIVVTSLLLAGALVAGVAVVTAMPTLRKDWTLPTWFALGLGWLTNIGTAYATVTGAKTFVRNDLGGLELVFTQDDGVANLGKAGLIGIAVVMMVRYGRARNQISYAPACAIALVGVSAFSNAYQGDVEFTNAILILVVLLSACIFVPQGKPAALGFAVFGISVGIVSALMTAASYAITVASCTRKCGVFGLLYFGVLNNENQLGVVLLCTLPFVWLAFEGRRRIILSLYLVGLVAVTGNRTATAVAIGMLLLLCVVRPAYTAEGAKGRAGPVLGATVLAMFLTSLLIPLRTADQYAFTGRGRLWLIARGYWAEHPWFGGGFDAWLRKTGNTSLGHITNYSPHSLWLDLGVAVGLVGVLLFFLMLVSLWRMSAPGGGYVLGIVVVTILALGTLEQPLTLWGTSSFTFALFALLLTTPQRQAPRSRLPDVRGDRLESTTELGVPSHNPRGARA